MSEEMINFTWPLGDNSDCDLCGFTWNEVGLDLWDEEENLWQLNIRVGCYEGDSVMSDTPEWDSKSADIIRQALMYPEFNEEEANNLRDKLEWIKERKMSDRMKKIIKAGEDIRQFDIELGVIQERKRIIDLLKYEASEWLSHDGTCDCRIRGLEVERLIEKIEESK